MISDFGRKLFAQPLSRIAPWLAGLGFTPNGITYVGFALTVVTAFFLARGSFVIGGLMLIVASFCDMLDGHLARATGQQSTFGALLDSTLDRYSESVTLLALAFHYSLTPGGRTNLLLVFATLVGSLMVSYIRARAEALNIECKAGLLQRPERIILMVIGLLFGWMTPVLWIQAIMTNFTALQRIYDVYWKTAHNPSPADKNVVK